MVHDQTTVNIAESTAHNDREVADVNRTLTSSDCETLDQSSSVLCNLEQQSLESAESAVVVLMTTDYVSDQMPGDIREQRAELLSGVNRAVQSDENPTVKSYIHISKQLNVNVSKPCISKMRKTYLKHKKVCVTSDPPANAVVSVGEELPKSSDQNFHVETAAAQLAKMVQEPLGKDQGGLMQAPNRGSLGVKTSAASDHLLPNTATSVDYIAISADNMYEINSNDRPLLDIKEPVCALVTAAGLSKSARSSTHSQKSPSSATPTLLGDMKIVKPVNSASVSVELLLAEDEPSVSLQNETSSEQQTPQQVFVDLQCHIDSDVATSTQMKHLVSVDTCTVDRSFSKLKLKGTEINQLCATGRSSDLTNSSFSVRSRTKKLAETNDRGLVEIMSISECTNALKSSVDAVGYGAEQMQSSRTVAKESVASMKNAKEDEIAPRQDNIQLSRCDSGYKQNFEQSSLLAESKPSTSNVEDWKVKLCRPVENGVPVQSSKLLQIEPVSARSSKIELKIVESSEVELTSADSHTIKQSDLDLLSNTKPSVSRSSTRQSDNGESSVSGNALKKRVTRSKTVHIRPYQPAQCMVESAITYAEADWSRQVQEQLMTFAVSPFAESPESLQIKDRITPQIEDSKLVEENKLSGCKLLTADGSCQFGSLIEVVPAGLPLKRELEKSKQDQTKAIAAAGRSVKRPVKTALLLEEKVGLVETGESERLMKSSASRMLECEDTKLSNDGTAGTLISSLNVLCVTQATVGKSVNVSRPQPCETIHCLQCADDAEILNDGRGNTMHSRRKSNCPVAEKGNDEDLGEELQMLKKNFGDQEAAWQANSQPSKMNNFPETSVGEDFSPLDSALVDLIEQVENTCNTLSSEVALSSKRPTNVTSVGSLSLPKLSSTHSTHVSHFVESLDKQCLELDVPISFGMEENCRIKDVQIKSKTCSIENESSALEVELPERANFRKHKDIHNSPVRVTMTGGSYNKKKVCPKAKSAARKKYPTSSQRASKTATVENEKTIATEYEHSQLNEPFEATKSSLPYSRCSCERSLNHVETLSAAELSTLSQKMNVEVERLEQTLIRRCIYSSSASDMSDDEKKKLVAEHSLDPRLEHELVVDLRLGTLQREISRIQDVMEHIRNSFNPSKPSLSLDRRYDQYEQKLNYLLVRCDWNYSRLNKLRRYYKSHLVFVIPDDMRLESERERHVSVEGIPLFVCDLTVGLKRCTRLAAITKSIIKYSHKGKKSDTSKLGWLHQERRNLLKELCCSSIQQRDSLVDSICDKLAMYK